MQQSEPQAPRAEKTSPLWGRSVAWLLFLGPFFFLSYGYANQLAEDRGITDALFFGWEQHIPFLPWTIVPYWSIDLLYGFSFLLCRTKLQVDRHALRLLTAQLISVAVFLALPLHFAFERPHVDGFFGSMFDALMGFDKPYNQAPSLHISLLVILWVRFAPAVTPYWRWAVHLWAVLIGVSVLTTYQHHFIDVPTGALVGLLCLWVWPDEEASPLATRENPGTMRHQRLAAFYFIGAGLLGAFAMIFKGAALWLWWPATALGLVAWIYVGPGAARGFQKHQGRHSVAVTILFAPYIAAAWLNSRWWTRHQPAPDAILDNVWLGRLPSTKDMRTSKFSGLVDLTAELPAPPGDWHYAGLAWLDLIPPSTQQLAESAHQIEALRVRGSVLVCCALGVSRSASAVLAWMILTGRAKDVDAAENILRAKRPQVVLGVAHRAALAQLKPLPQL
jgi:protein-tyrosine phosphatase